MIGLSLKEGDVNEGSSGPIDPGKEKKQWVVIRLKRIGVADNARGDRTGQDPEAGGAKTKSGLLFVVRGEVFCHCRSGI